MVTLKGWFLALMLLGLMLARPAVARAGVLDYLEIDASAGLGGPIGLIGASYPGGVSTTPFTLILAGRIGLPRYTPLKLELNVVIPNGFGANLRLDAIRIDRVVVHLPDIGVFWNAFRPVSAARIARTLDFTIGGGVDVRVWNNLSVGAEWRCYLPNPVTVIPDYDGFAYPAYQEALRGGQLWLNASYSW